MTYWICSDSSIWICRARFLGIWISSKEEKKHTPELKPTVFRVSFTAICSLPANALTGLHVPLLEGRVQHLVAPVLLGEVLQGAAVRLHLLVQPAAIDEHWGTALGVPAPLSKHLLQLLDGVAALPLADAVLLHAAVAAPQRLCVVVGQTQDPLSCLWLELQFYGAVTHITALKS